MSWDEIIKGGSGNDFLSGGSGNDFLQGKAGGDTLDGGTGDDQLHGDAGDDHVRGGVGNDLLHGGLGTDRAYYSGSVLEYSFARDGDNFFVSHTGGSMIDGYDRLISIERLVFADAVIDLTQNNAPVAFNDSASTHEDVGTYSGPSVLANDFDWENNSLTAVPGSFAGVYGMLVLNSNGTYTYTPYASTQSLDDGETVQDSFTYTVSDGSLSDTGTLTIIIAGRNDAPAAGDDSATASEESGASGNVLANDSDVDVETLTVANPGTYVGTYGTLVIAADGSYTYSPGPNAQALDDGEIGQDVFTYMASDGTASDSATLTVTVSGTNDAPAANDDSASATEDGGASGNVLANDSDVDGESLTVSNPGTYFGAYGTLVLAADGSYTYTPGAAAQGLDDGEVGQDVFTYVASDGTASDSATLTVSVAGLNDAPVANDDTASASEDGGASGNVLANDSDVDGDILTVANPGTYVGAYGTLILAADGSYSYTPGAAAQALDDGETVQDVFTYSASDGTASDLATLTVTVAGLNDAPLANDDSASATEQGGASGNVLANDSDVDGESLTVANPGTYVGAYGILVLAADGSYTYTPGAAAKGLDDGEAVSDSFSYAASDGTASDSATLTVTVAGLNDAPVASDDSAATGEDSSVSGNVLANDGDIDGEALAVGNPGSYAGTYGTLTLAADGSYTYAPNAAANGLAAGQAVQDSFAYTATDGTTSDAATLTVTVTGTNDSPTIDVAGTDASGSITESPDGSAAENMIVHSDSGSVAFDDVDLTDTHTASFAPQSGGYLGSFTLDPVDQAGDSVGWDFSVSDEALDSLEEGEVVTQTYTITIDDGNGGTATQEVTITLTGAGDDKVWYIDNSAAGSANLGTEADPFTSIAAFNAAQGTVGGPAEGELVYLLHGTGTYAEADGIDLLDGQVLTGIGDPTIAPTAGDGINVGSNNSISGINIVAGAGDGIAHSGGSVGALSVSEVNITTTSGDGIDLASGGANVQIANATISTGSGYAILAANIAGFALTTSTVSSGASSSGTVSLTELTGAADFLGNSLNGGGGDTLGISLGSGNLDLTISDHAGQEAVIGANGSSTGDDGVSVTTSGNASLSLNIVGVDFEGARSDLLEVNALGNSTQSLTITGNNFHNTQAGTGGGVLLSGGGIGSNIDVDFAVEGNSFTGSNNSALTASYSQQSGHVRGNIEGNTIGVDDGVATAQGAANGGSGIAVSLEKAPGAGNASMAVSIVDNEIRDIDSGFGIFLRSNGGGAANPAVLEATVSGNVVEEFGDFAFAALYAVVGGTAFSGDFARLGLDLDDNVFDLSGADYGSNAIYLDQVSSDAHFYFPGYGGSADGEYMGGTASGDLHAFFSAKGNAMTNGAFPSFPGGVDAGLIMGATGDSFVHPVWP
jgi:VCBS repeat-containing protein